jgi:hypothetical protein
VNDNIVFWLDSDFMPFVVGHFLQKKHTGNFFAIIDTTEKTKIFFKQQKLVNFKKVWDYNYNILPKPEYDVNYLLSFEKKYNINLWLLAINERIFSDFNLFYSFSRDEILSILEQECKLFEKVLEESNPGFLITKNIDLHQNFLFSEMCRSKNIKILMLEVSRFSGSIITEKLDTIDYIKPLDKYDSKYDQKNIKDFLKNKNRSIELTEQRKSFTPQKFNFKRVKAFFNFFFSSSKHDKMNFAYFGRSKLRVIFKYAQFPLREKYRKFFIDNNLLKKINFKEPFLFYPLHEEPERTLLIGSPFYTNQIEIIRHIAKSLPITHILLVKEHPSQEVRGWRVNSFYKEIMNIPNVVLIHPDVSVHELIEKSSLVISISGTAAIESAFYEKPSIVFVDTIFSNLSFVEKVNFIPELPKIIRTSLEKKVDLSELIHFISMLEDNTFDYNHIWFNNEFANVFYYGGNLANVDISENHLKSFLDEHHIIFEKLTSEYIKKIDQHKKMNLESSI